MNTVVYRPSVRVLPLVAVAGFQICFPEWCAAGDSVNLDIGTLIQMASGVTPVVYAMIALFVLLLACNAANTVTALHILSTPVQRKIFAHIRSADYAALRSLSGGAPGNIVLKSVCAGIKQKGHNQSYLDTAAVLASFKALNRKYYLLPKALKTFGVIVLLLSIWAVGSEMIRFYMELHDRMAVVVGDYPFRKIFQAGSARIMVLAIGGLSVSVTAIVCGYLFSGSLRLLLTRKTSDLVNVLSQAETSVW